MRGFPARQQRTTKYINLKRNRQAIFLTTTTAALATPASIDEIEVSSSPEDFKARRLALNVSPQQLASLLGVSEEMIGLIESTPLGGDVAFLHNLALSLLEESHATVKRPVRRGPRLVAVQV